jgi:hypothetical protein
MLGSGARANAFWLPSAAAARAPAPRSPKSSKCQPQFTSPAAAAPTTTAQEEEGLWLQPPAPLTLRLPAAAVLSILDADYGQRQDERGVHNPHGEHAHDVWALRAPPASTRVFGRRRRE